MSYPAIALRVHIQRTDPHTRLLTDSTQGGHLRAESRPLHDYSLDDEIKTDEKQTKIDFLPSVSQSQEEIIIEDQQKKELESSLKEAIQTLNEREAYIINNRLLSDKQITLEKLGEKFGSILGAFQCVSESVS